MVAGLLTFLNPLKIQTISAIQRIHKHVKHPMPHAWDYLAAREETKPGERCLATPEDIYKANVVQWLPLGWHIRAVILNICYRRVSQLVDTLNAKRDDMVLLNDTMTRESGPLVVVQRPKTREGGHMRQHMVINGAAEIMYVVVALLHVAPDQRPNLTQLRWQMQWPLNALTAVMIWALLFCALAGLPIWVEVPPTPDRCVYFCPHKHRCVRAKYHANEHLVMCGECWPLNDQGAERSTSGVKQAPSCRVISRPFPGRCALQYCRFAAVTACLDCTRRVCAEHARECQNCHLRTCLGCAGDHLHRCLGPWSLNRL